MSVTARVNVKGRWFPFVDIAMDSDDQVARVIDRLVPPSLVVIERADGAQALVRTGYRTVKLTVRAWSDWGDLDHQRPITYTYSGERNEEGLRIFRP